MGENKGRQVADACAVKTRQEPLRFRPAGINFYRCCSLGEQHPNLKGE